MSTLPSATSKPCNDCPWRRVAAPGWLGPMSADEWVALASSDEPIACHLTLPEGGFNAWDTDGVRQCQGAAIYRRNICKMPRNTDDAAIAATADRDLVFAHQSQFLEHHERGIDR